MENFIWRNVTWSCRIRKKYFSSMFVTIWSKIRAIRISLKFRVKARYELVGNVSRSAQPFDRGHSCGVRLIAEASWTSNANNPTRASSSKNTRIFPLRWVYSLKFYSLYFGNWRIPVDLWLIQFKDDSNVWELLMLRWTATASSSLRVKLAQNDLNVSDIAEIQTKTKRS